MSDNEKTLTDAYYWLSMYKSGAITKGVAIEKVKEAIFEQPQLNENQQKWINRLKFNYAWFDYCVYRALHATLQEPEMHDLPQNEFAQVLEVFSRWVQE
ncbi:hypothetical protein [Enterococcus casseliflavus]|uniref:hypothetical protein n=1 Tax=Enterococcus casseliflavus TaxID=37734 RepID=UPI003D0F20F2